MTRRANARSIGLAAALAGLSLAPCAGAALAQTPRAERPTYQVGDKWIRSDGTYQLARMDRDVYVFSSGGGNEVHLSRNLGLAKIVADGHATFEVEPAVGLSWPLDVEGLAGKADRNGDGLVTVSELYEYVEDQMDRKAREAGGRQRPLMKGEIEGTLPLSRAPR